MWHKGWLTRGEEGDASVTVIEDLLGHSTFDLDGFEKLSAVKGVMTEVSGRQQ